MRRALAALVATVGVALVVAAPAGAHRVWQPPEQLSTPGYTGHPGDLVVDARGDVIASYSESLDYSNGDFFIALKPAGAPVVRLPVPNASEHISLATDGSGNTLAVWRDSSNGEYLLARRPPGGTFGAPQRLGNAPGSAGLVGVKANARGDAAIVWTSWDPGREGLLAQFGSTTGDFGEPVMVRRTGDVGWSDDTVLTDDGELIAFFNNSTNGLSGTVEVAARRIDGPEQDPVEVSDGATYPWVLGVYTSPAGDAVTWTSRTWTSDWDPARTYIAERPRGGAWAAGREVPELQDINGATMAMSGDGTVTAVKGDITFFSGAFGSPGLAPIAGPGILWGAQAMATNRAGETLVWARPDWNHATTTRRAGTGPLGPVEDVRTDCGYIDDQTVALGDDGTAAALLSRRNVIDLVVDRPSSSTGAQECVDSDGAYGRVPRDQPPRYPTPDWMPPPGPAPGYPTSPLSLGVGSVSVDRTSTSRTVLIELACNRKCALESKASLRLKGGDVLARAEASKDTARSGRAKLRLVLKLSRTARKKAAESKQPLQIEIRLTARDLVLGRQKVVRKITRRVR